MLTNTFVVIFSVALALRLINLSLISDIGLHAMIEDSSMYWTGAAAWLESGYFSRALEAGFVPETERVPLYFLFLVPFRWLFGDTVVPVVIGQAFLDAGTCVIIARIGSMMNSTVGVLSGFLAAIWPNLIIHSSMVLTDTLFVFLFSLVLFFAAKFLTSGRMVDAGLAGLLCGLAIMTRPVAQFLPFAMAIVVPFVVSRHGGSWNKGIAAALIVFAMAAAPALPILARNVSQFGTIQLTNMTGTHVQNWVVGYVRALEEGTSFNANSKLMNATFAEMLARENIDPDSLNPFEESARRIAFAKVQLKEVPFTTIARAWLYGAVLNIAAPALVVEPRIRKFNRNSFVNSSGVTLAERVGSFVSTNNSTYVFWLVFGLATGGVAVLLQFCGWMLLCRWRPVLAVFATLSILYFLLINGPVASPKYRLPFEPILIILQAVAIIELVSRMRRLSSERSAGSGIANTSS